MSTYSDFHLFQKRRMRWLGREGNRQSQVSADQLTLYQLEGAIVFPTLLPAHPAFGCQLRPCSQSLATILFLWRRMCYGGTFLSCKIITRASFNG